MQRSYAPNLGENGVKIAFQLSNQRLKLLASKPRLIPLFFFFLTFYALVAMLAITSLILYIVHVIFKPNLMANFT